ncbi:MAG TPA: ribokinase [Gaiellaceae bacterium]
MRDDGGAPIVVVGSHVPGLFLRVEAVPREGETVLAHSYREPEDGGKASNQAVAAAKLGAPVRLVTLVGDDERGRRWRDIFFGYGIDTTYVLEAAGPTDVGFVMLPPSKIPAIASSIEQSRALDGDFVASVAPAVADASVVVCQLEAPQSCAVASFRIAREVGATTILNPAPAADLDPELVALTDVLVPNELEAAALAGSTAPPSELARILHERYRCAVIVTAGPAGCVVADQAGCIDLPAAVVEVADTTGAGDAFVGALAVRLRAGDEVASAAAFALTVASFSVGRSGTMPSFPSGDDLLPSTLAPA